MRRAIIAVIVIIVLTLALGAQAHPLKVSTSKKVYSPGSTVKIRIEGKPNAVYGVEVRGPSQLIAKQVKTDSNGVAIVELVLTVEGKYTVYVAGSGEAASTSFEIKRSTSGGGSARPPTGTEPSLREQAVNAIELASARLGVLKALVGNLSEVFTRYNVNASLGNATALVEEAEKLLDEARSEMEEGDYGEAKSLAMEAYEVADSGLEEAIGCAKDSLSGIVDQARNSTDNELALLLLDLAEERMGNASPDYPEDSIDLLVSATKLLVAALRVANADILADTVEKLSRSLDETKRSLEELGKEAEALKAKVEELESEKSELLKKLEETESALEDAEKKVEELESENENLKSRSAELESRVRGLERMLGSRVDTGLAAGLAVVAAVAGLALGYLIRAKLVAE